MQYNISGSDSSMDDCNDNVKDVTAHVLGVQIPLWTIVTDRGFRA